MWSTNTWSEGFVFLFTEINELVLCDLVKLNCFFFISRNFIGNQRGRSSVHILNPSLFSDLFHSLCDLIEIINSTLTFPLVFVTFYILILNMLSCYSHILSITIMEEQFFMTLLTDGLALAMNLILLMIFIDASVRTTNKMKETPVIISKIVNSKNFSENEQEILTNFLTQIQYRNLNFENPLFTIDWKLLLGVSS